jgi:hypothetical protein
LNLCNRVIDCGPAISSNLLSQDSSGKLNSLTSGHAMGWPCDRGDRWRCPSGAIFVPLPVINSRCCTSVLLDRRVRYEEDTERTKNEGSAETTALSATVASENRRCGAPLAFLCFHFCDWSWPAGPVNCGACNVKR